MRWLEDHGDVLYRYAIMQLAHHDRAEDAVQETLLAAVRSQTRFEGASSVRTWLIGILNHKIADEFRAQSRRSRRLEALMRDEATPAGAPAVKSDEEGVELRAELEEAIRRLPEGPRAAFCLREIGGLETAEICEVLGVSANNLWTLISRAKRQLREALTDRWFDAARVDVRARSGDSR